MANTPDYYLKLLVGDLLVQLALIKAENDALREEIATLKAPRPEPPKA